jgi:exodeoxyribonuclease V beta subunit
MDGRPADQLPSLDQLRDPTRHALGRPGILLEPTSEDQGATRAQVVRRNLVEASVSQVSERRRIGGTVSFDGVLSDLWTVLTGPQSAAAVESLRSRFKVALIDEFQDTDPVQWKIFHKLFGERAGGTSMVVVGDPKQAIYGFRGGDIETYVEAIGQNASVERRSMSRNWRSDTAVLTALNTLFTGATFGDEAIRFVPVVAARDNQSRRLHMPTGSPAPALSVRLAVGGGLDRTKAGEVVVSSAAEAIEQDLVARVRELLDSGVLPKGRDGSQTRPVRPHDIAVLVNTNQQCADMKEALSRQGVPAVVAKGGNVLASPAADQMRWLLHAMARPSDPRRARTYALSWFGGLSAEELASSLSDADLAEIQEQLRDWAERLATNQVADVLARIWSSTGVVANVLATPDGDRNMTDLDHLAELLHGATPTGRSNVAGLLAVLDDLPDTDTDTELEGDIAARRIESEAQAVQVMTVWAAKGLEFPIVCVPMLWRWNGGNDPVIYLDHATNTKTLDLANGLTWPNTTAAKERKEQAAAAMAGERLRLLYVALTRAQHHTIVWWANGKASSKTALAKVLFARNGAAIDPGAYLSPTVPIPEDDDMVAALSPLVAAAEGTIAVQAIDGPSTAVGRWVDGNETVAPPHLEAARLTAVLDRSKRRWSFSAMTDSVDVGGLDHSDLSSGEGSAADEGPVDGKDHGPEDPDDGHRPDDLSPLTSLPAGVDFGNLVHGVLEKLDFSADEAELPREIGAAANRQLALHPVDLVPVDDQNASFDDGRRLLVEGLMATLRTPLGAVGRYHRLADIRPSDRLNELSFDLRLGEGGRVANVAEIGRVVAAHLDPSDLLAPWAGELAAGAIDVPLAGHLTGSIDLVLRVPADDGGHRYVVVDYKTNALTPRGKRPARDDYHPAQMAEAMTEHHYPLQALLYSVCLHRYLRWRLPDYQPHRHLGGVAYLFVRGMSGPDVPISDGRVHGVFDWAVPPALVIELSDLLDGQDSSEALS